MVEQIVLFKQLNVCRYATVWGRGGEPVYLAVALLGYDPDDEDVAASTAAGAPPQPPRDGGLVDPVLTSAPDNGARVFAVNPDGSVGGELLFTKGHGFTLPPPVATATTTPAAVNQTANATAAAAGAGTNNNNTITASGTPSSNASSAVVVVASPAAAPAAPAPAPGPISTTVPASVAVVPGAMFYLRMADARRGAVTLRWRARDASGVLSAREGVITVASAGLYKLNPVYP
jgi:hypothetical protein